MHMAAMRQCKRKRERCNEERERWTERNAGKGGDSDDSGMHQRCECCASESAWSGDGRAKGDEGVAFGVCDEVMDLPLFVSASLLNAEPCRGSRGCERDGRVHCAAEVGERNTLRYAVAQELDGACTEVEQHTDHIAGATKLFAVID